MGNRCSSLVSVAVVNTTTKGNLGGKCLFHFTDYSPSRRDTEGPKAENMEESCCLACSASYLSYIDQACLPMDGTKHSGLGPLNQLAI